MILLWKKNFWIFGKEIFGVNVFCINKYIIVFIECKIIIIIKYIIKIIN